MVFLKLLGCALGSVVMYWGVALLCFTPWLLAFALVVVSNQIWNKMTGRTEEWKWILGCFDGMGQMIQVFKIEWVGCLPALLIQIWYAGYAAHLVHSSTLEASTEYAIAVHMTGVLGMVIAIAVFYWLYTQAFELKLRLWIYGLVAGTALSAYCVFLQQPQTAVWLSEGWTRVFIVMLGQLLESIFSS
ncbi:MAG: hypothetical protein SFY66_00200 [Oculatellaceae cyanobacterium bins.114]|nr:hypothetical protein [Oculatellaceae cyanobacterium bins.114]